MMQRFQTLFGLGVALLLGNATLLLAQPFWDAPRFLAAVALVFALPGWAWLPPLGWLQTQRGLERLVLIFGLSSLLSALALLLTVFLPGPFTEQPALIALNLVTLAGLIYQAVNTSQAKIHRASVENPQSRQRYAATSTQASEIQNLKSKIEWPSRTVLFILLAIVAVAAFTRLTRIGYAEFHEDELENMRLIIRAYKGEEYAPFLDSKGPIHWLLPAALWYFNGWVNEGIARTPFALTALMLVPMMFVLGKRVSGDRDHIGLLAAGFVALNGFFVAYSRHVENQSLIVFWGALAVWFAYRYYREDRWPFLVPLALTVAVGLVAHPDVLLYLPVFAFIIGVYLWQHRREVKSAWLWLAGAGLVFVGVVAFFYVPYLFDPSIGLVYQYFAGDRIGEALTYNRVANLFDQDNLYSTRYHAPVLVLLLVWLFMRHFARWGRPGWLLLGGLGSAVVTTVLWPNAWLLGTLNLAFVPYAVLALIFILSPQVSVEMKMIFLWFSAPLGALLFLAKDAADHIQVAYTAWALLAAFALADLWRYLDRPVFSLAATPRPVHSGTLGLTPTPWPPAKVSLILKSVLVISLATIIGLIVFYQYLAFGATVTTYWQAKIDSADNPDSIYNLLYGSIPRPRKIFSNPRLGGWKAVGYLWETGAMSGDFRSINESFAVPIWYTFQTPRSCYDDPQNSWVRRDWQGWPEEEQLLAQGYTLTRVILVDQEPKLHLYEKNGSATAPEIIDSEAYRHQFDRLATPARFAQERTGRQSATFNFGGDRLRLLGYDFPARPIEPGALVPITVYWETLAPMSIRYRAFMHLVDGDGRQWGQHDDDPACRLLTTDMRPGQRSSRQFRLPVASDIPPGEYSVTFGLYDPDSGRRLEIWDAAARQNVGDHLVLGRLPVQE